MTVSSTSPMASHALAISTCLVLEAAVIGWNGLLLSEAADAVPIDKVATATAGCLFFSFCGVMT
jgi:hypothetical protein